jgi:beta-glucanase (GH16 family)
VSGGCLSMSTTKDASSNYFSGWIDGQGKKWIDQGVHVEIRAREPSGKGIWPALWFDPQSPSTWPPELDLLEVLGKDPGVAYMTTHYTSSNWSSQGIFTGPALSGAFHVYALEWEAGVLRWYIDGALKFTTTDGVPASAQTMYPILNTAVGSAGEWGGAPDATTVFPEVHSIDYIRVYTR